jgi:hypothetical protein
VDVHLLPTRVDVGEIVDLPNVPPSTRGLAASFQGLVRLVKAGGEQRNIDGEVVGADPRAIGETGKTADVPHAVASG